MVGLNSVQTEDVEAQTQDRCRGLRGAPSAPAGEADPISEFTSLMLGVEMEADASHDSVALGGHGESDPLLGFPGSLVRFDPFLGHPVLVRMGDGQRGRRYLMGSREALHGRCVVCM